LYEKQILRILLDVGARGISVKKLAKHVYNHYCTLFFKPDFDEIYRSVQYYLRSRADKKKSPIEHAEKYGHYRIKPRRVASVRQLFDDIN
jgi:DNA repair protein RadC